VTVEQPKYCEIEAIVTCYSENDDHTPGDIMANGKRVHYGAVANDVLPMGTKVLIDGETFVVSDRFGGGYPVEKFDMYLPSRADCIQWGRQKKIVRILEDKSD